MVKYKKSLDFYNQKYNELKNNIDLFSNKVPLYNIFLSNNKLVTDSWYDAKIYNSSVKDNNNYTFIDYDLERPKKILKCEKIILLPTKIQIKSLLNMLEGYRLIYNYTLKFIKTREYNNIHNKRIILDNEIIDSNEKLNYLKEIRDQKKNLSDNEKICVSLIDDVIGNIFKKDIRQSKISKLKEDDNNDMILDDKILKTYFLKDEIHRVSKKFKTPVHTLNYAVQLACASYKSCLANLKNGHIKNFNIRYIKSTKSSLIMDIEKCVINKKTFISSVVGKEIKNTQNLDYIANNDCKLHYNRNKNIFTLLIPKEIPEIIKKNEKNEYISIDLGLRTLMNCKTNKEYIEIGNNVKDKLKKYLEQEDKYKLIKNNKIKNKLLKRLRENIKNKVDDLHWKSINYLTSNYKNIIIGKWSTKNIISRKDSILHRMNKRIIQSISYYKLIERLKFKSIINNNNLIIKEEWYTSKTCTLCGNKKEDLGGNKIYSCVKCNLTTNRDYNGCRNIFLSCIKSIN